MSELPPAPSAMDPTFSSSDQKSYTPRPLTSSSFTGMVNNSPSAVAHRYRYTSLSTQGPTNGPLRTSSDNLYNSRLAADLELSKDPDRGYNGWNKKRQEAIDRGEDPNAEWLAKTEARLPDSFLERGWRKLTGKGKTRKEERERKEMKKAHKRHIEEEGGEGNTDRETALGETPGIYNGLGGKKAKEDGVIR